MITLMSVIVAFLFAISLWYLSSNHKVTFVKLKATYLKFLPNRGWHRLIPAGGTFVSATGGTFQSDTPGTFVSAVGGTFDSDIPGTFESATGGTFNPLLSIKNLFQYFDEIEKEESTSDEDRRLIKEIRESVRTSKGISKADLDKIQKKDNKAVTDIENVFTENLQRVGQTFAGVEIVQFCSNENYREFFDSLGFFPHFGAVVFWRFLVPIVLEVRKYIGCQYLFLFAADTSDDESLIRYYRTLHFTDVGQHGAVIPLYDWTCRFMYQEISGLPEGEEEFFNDFNRDEEDV